MQALEEGRRRAALEQQSSERAIAMDKQHLEVRSQVGLRVHSMPKVPFLALHRSRA
jgi:hypothetical protein